MKNKLFSINHLSPKNFGSTRFTVLIILLLLVILSCSSLMAINFYTVKTMSAVRSFINGESVFSKAQKDGSRHLQLYLSDRNEADYKFYIKNLSIEVNDSLALHGFLSPDNEPIVQHFIGGRNNASDSRDMVWLVRNFKDVSFLQHIFIYWRGANSLVAAMHIRAIQAHNQILAGTYTLEKQQTDISDINIWDDGLTWMEQHFSDTLDEASRVIRQYLLTAEFAMILLILGLNCVYSVITIRKLFTSSKVLELKNQSLTDTNLELDRFVYSASHDLRAPITSLKGLLKVIKDEDELSVIREYHAHMETSLNQQDEFIKEIINYSRNKRTDLNVEVFSITKLIEASIRQHAFMLDNEKIDFRVESYAGDICSDSLRLTIILNNLLSNAVKFRDESKPEHIIIIRCAIEKNNLKLEVQDNGIGIQEKYMPKIFDMFFVTLHSKRGSGLGLYITRETLTKLGGTVSVVSEAGVGSCFAVSIPLPG